MASGLIALLDDVATIAKLAAASVDDVGLAVGKAGSKAAGVVIDDTAVTPRYVTGFTPDRELPIIGKIALGSIKNKFLILIGALALSAFLPMVITPLLMIGGAYLAFEGTEKIIEKLTGDHHSEEELMEADTPEELEQRQVAGAVRTDFILSAEIMIIALAQLGDFNIWMRAAALAAVGIVITVAVYGAVALIVKLDDIGLHLTERRNRAGQAIGRALVKGVPKMLVALAAIGTAAMLWVGGGIILHGLEELHLLEAVPHAVHDTAHALAGSSGGARMAAQRARLGGGRADRRPADRRRIDAVAPAPGSHDSSRSAAGGSAHERIAAGPCARRSSRGRLRRSGCNGRRRRAPRGGGIRTRPANPSAAARRSRRSTRASGRSGLLRPGRSGSTPAPAPPAARSPRNARPRSAPARSAPAWRCRPIAEAGRATPR